MNSRSSRALFLSLVVGCLLLPCRALAQAGGEYDRALAEFRAGNYSSAAASFANIDAASPGGTDALVYRSKCLVHLHDFPGAEKALHSYLELHHDSSDALYMLGFVLNRENRPADSLAAYTQAAAITPPTSDDLKIVGLDYVLLNDNADAIKWLEKAVAFDSKNKDAWYYLGREYYTRSRLNEARKAFQTVLDLDPRNARAENNLGLILESDAQPSAAIEAFQKAIGWQENDPNKNEQPYVNLGSLLIEQGKIKEAIEPLEKSVKLAPKNAFCRLRLGTAYLRMNDFDRAEGELEKATALDPSNPIAHYQLGRFYKETHQLDRARSEFEQAADLQARAAGSDSGGHKR
jgi:tetratricopeptide (TPR) repeat protein